MKTAWTAAAAGWLLVAGVQGMAGESPAASGQLAAKPTPVAGVKKATAATVKSGREVEIRKQAAVKKIVNEHLLFEINREDPELGRKLEAMRRHDPEAFTAAIEDYARKSSAAKKRKTEEFRHLVEEYLLNPNEELKKEIKNRLAEVYDRKIRWEKDVIAKWQKKLHERQEKLKKIEAERDTLIDEQFEKITQWQW
ncbi:MAG: TM1812 family CRISPR-associated protein [Victivallales bacterium]|nr:TM1812 family CRISPR-associated protein [Victivallales bacterium]